MLFSCNIKLINYKANSLHNEQKKQKFKFPFFFLEIYL